MLKRTLPVVILIAFSLNACGSSALEETTEAARAETAIPITETVAPTKDAEVTEVAPHESTMTPVSEAMGVEFSELEGVLIEVWRVLNYGEHAEGMMAIVDAFNAENEWGIVVELNTYENAEEDILAAAESGKLPDAILSNSAVLAEWYKDDRVVDITPYINNPTVGLTDEEKADFYQSIFDSATIADGVRVGFPLSQTINVLFYNKTWAQELGFENPPQTSVELKQQACAAAAANNTDEHPENDGTGGLVLYPGATNVMSWLFVYGDDGLADDSTAYDFTSAAAQAVAAIWKEMWDEGCAFPTETYPNPEFATRQALFIMSSNVEIPYLDRAFETEDATEDEWTVLSFVGPDGTKAVNTYGQYFGIVDTTPEKKLAIWLFLKYFTSPEIQAEWSDWSAYYPVRKSARVLLEDYGIEHPQWGYGLDLLEYGQVEPFMTSWKSVRRVVFDAFKCILQGNAEDIPLMLEELDATAAELRAEVEE